MEDAREALVPLGSAILPEALEVYARLRGYRARVALVYTCMKFALSRPEAVTLARRALADRSGPVRYRACMLLAVSGDRGALPDLRALLDHRSAETRADAQAAIAAIEEGNQNLFLDRDRTGRVKMSIGGLEPAPEAS